MISNQMTGAIGIGQASSLSTATTLRDASAAYSDSQNYFDLRSLDKIGKLANTENPDDQYAALEKIGGQFESMLLKQMLKSMRQVNEVLFEDSYFNPERVRFYQGMLDDQMTLTLGQGGGLGIADQFVRNLSSRFGVGSGADSSAPFAAQVTPEIRKYTGNAGSSMGLDSGRSNALAVGVPKPIAASAINTSAASRMVAAENTQKNDTNSRVGSETISANDSKSSFVERLLPSALPIAQRLGLKVSQLIAQAVLETGWGEKIIKNRDGQSSHNLFGIKAAGDWRGETAETLTTEYLGGQPVKIAAEFRHYDSFKESFSDFFHFLTSSERYADVLKQPAEKFYYALQSAGYATDPLYAEKVYDLADRIESSILR